MTVINSAKIMARKSLDGTRSNMVTTSAATHSAKAAKIKSGNILLYWA
jgi:hypothetical protein